MADYGLILSGGLALGAYQRGCIDHLLGQPDLTLKAIAGSSIGAINGAIVAGNPPDRRAERLASFWSAAATDSFAEAWIDPIGLLGNSEMRKGLNWLNVAGARLFGSPALFRPRGLLEHHPSQVPSLYSSDRLVDTLLAHIDFALLNEGDVRFVCATTDIETGACVLFDTLLGDRVEVEHLIASGGLLPSFAPIPIGGRLLGDGGFAANAPLEPFLASDRKGETYPLCFLIDLFPAAGPKPPSLSAAAERAEDLKYACQTRMRLEAVARERSLEVETARGRDQPGTDLLFLSYGSQLDEPGPEKAFSFRAATLDERAGRGRRDAARACVALPCTAGASGLRIHDMGAVPAGELSCTR
jgi:NTE family protein